MKSHVLARILRPRSLLNQNTKPISDKTNRRREKILQISSMPEKQSFPPAERNEKDSFVDQEVKKAVLTGLGHFAPRSVEFLVNFMEQEHSVDFNTIADNPRLLRAALSKMFGDAEQIVESRICQALAEPFGIDGTGKSLEDLISIIRSVEPAK